MGKEDTKDTSKSRKLHAALQITRQRQIQMNELGLTLSRKFMGSLLSTLTYTAELIVWSISEKFRQLCTHIEKRQPFKDSSNCGV